MSERGTQRPTLQHLTEAVTLPPDGRCIMDGCYGECVESESFCGDCLYDLRWGAA